MIISVDIWHASEKCPYHLIKSWHEHEEQELGLTVRNITHLGNSLKVTQTGNSEYELRQQLPKQVTVSVYEHLPKLWWLPVWVTVVWQLPKRVTLSRKHSTFWTLHAIRFLFMQSVFLKKKGAWRYDLKFLYDKKMNKMALVVIF